MLAITADFRFEAAHILPNHEGKCSRLHGHSWQGWVKVTGPLDPIQHFIMDYAVLKMLINEYIVGPFDHTYLGAPALFQKQIGETPDVIVPTAPVYPTCENLVQLFADSLIGQVSACNCQLLEVGLKETCTTSAIWTADFTFPPGMFVSRPKE
jgi:6-pyruvoyl tetrahydropterin synthase/QueD family protein